jgi:hypothetical protein
MKDTQKEVKGEGEASREAWETVSGGIDLPEGYTLWTRRNAGERIWTVRQTSEGEPTPTSGGYFSIESAIKVKGFKFAV